MKTVLPGMGDSHLHFFAFCQTYTTVNLGGATSKAEALQLLRKRAAETPKGEWIKGSKGWVFMYPLFIVIACAFSNVTTMYMITDGFMGLIVILNMIGVNRFWNSFLERSQTGFIFFVITNKNSEM